MECRMLSLDMSKGLVPLPKHRRRLVVVKDARGRWSKPPGVGWDALGARTIRGITLHRMQGTLWGTDGHYRSPSVGALADWGVDHQTGELLLWNDPTGEVTPWASGPVADPYGDGAAFLAKHAGPSGIGVHVADRDRVSIEIAGYFVHPGESMLVESPWSDVSLRVVAQLCAHYAHDYGIAWNDYPIAPADGISFLAWHHEFSRGSGKVCPGRLVMDLTDELIGRTRSILRAHQTGAAAGLDADGSGSGIAYPDGISPELAAELFGQVQTPAGVARFDELDPVSRLWLELGAVQEPDRFPRLAAVIAGRAASERYFRFEGGLLIRQKGRLVEVVDATSPAERAAEERIR
jgi:hypothetical protein